MEGTKEWVRKVDVVDPAVEEYEARHLEEIRAPMREEALEDDELSKAQPESSEEQKVAQ